MERPFREFEKLVIIGLTQDAHLTGASLARKCGMKESNVCSIRRRLIDSRQIYFANVPSFHKLGCKMVVQLYESTNPAVPKDIKDTSHLAFLDETPEVFDSVSGEGATRLLLRPDGPEVRQAVHRRGPDAQVPASGPVSR
jgi:hypothetical protein